MPLLLRGQGLYILVLDTVKQPTSASCLFSMKSQSAQCLAYGKGSL